MTRKRKILIVIFILALGACAFIVVIVPRFIREAELTHLYFPEVRDLEYILMRYLDDNGGLPADETQLIAQGHIRKIHQGADENFWEFKGGYSLRDPSWYKLHFFEDFSISYGLTTIDMELSGDVVVDKVKKAPLLIINGPGSDKYPEFYQTQTFNLYNCMCRNFNWAYHLDLEWTLT